MRRILGVLAVGLTLYAPLPASAALMQLTDLFVFGDSLSDAGNSGLRSQEFAGSGVVFPPFPYYNGQFSNGPVAVEYLWNRYNPGNPGGLKPSLAGGTDYAIGGATTGVQNYNAMNPMVPAALHDAYLNYGNAWQLDQFAADQPVFDPATSLFVVWLFPNDIFYANQTGTLPGVVPGSPGGANVVENGIANILTTIQILAAAGPEHFLVPNLADLGETPAFRGTPQEPLLSALSAAFNDALGTQLAALDQDLPAEIVEFDTAAAFAEILADPDAFGFSNTTDACVDNLLNGQCNPGNWDTWMFWDGVHPTTRTHQLLAAEFQAAIPEPASLALEALALLALAVVRRRATGRTGCSR